MKFHRGVELSWHADSSKPDRNVNIVGPRREGRQEGGEQMKNDLHHAECTTEENSDLRYVAKRLVPVESMQRRPLNKEQTWET